MKKVKLIQKFERGKARFIKFCDGNNNFDIIVTNNEFNNFEQGKFYEINYNLKNFLNSYNEIKDNSEEYNKIIQKNIKFKKEFIYSHPHLKSLEKRYNQFLEILIRTSIEGRTIFIRNDNDADGTSAGVLFEIAIRELKKKYDLSGSQIINRTPMMKTHYSKSDALFDAFKSGYSCEPLFVILDHGSDDQNIVALKIIKQLGFQIAIIDHHDFRGDLTVEKMCDAHINPYLENGDSSLCTGVLTFELIKKLDINYLDHVPALPAIADHCPEEVSDFYFEFAKKKFNVKTKDELSVYINGIDNFCRSFRTQAMSEFLIKFYKSPKDYFEICNVLYQNDNNEIENFTNKIKHYVKKEKGKKYNYILIGIDEIVSTNHSLGTRQMARALSDNYSDKNTVLILKTNIGFTFRVGDECNFSVTDFLTQIRIKFPHAFIDGGGHPKAGTIVMGKEVMDQVMTYLKSQL